MGAVLQWIERVLFTIAALCLAYAGVTLIEVAQYRTAARELVAAARPAAGAVTDAAARPASGPGTAPGVAVPASKPTDPAAGADTRVPVATRARARSATGLIGMLEIPHLGVSTAILEGDDWQALRRGAGHLSGTPLPGHPGNVVLAGHRDTVFRRLGQVDRGDRLRITTRDGTFDYRVSRVFRVAPHEVWVMDRAAAALTLITCYPFTWVGSAPERWIVQAEAESH